ncbi:SusC/RagA family TonB-linked outer membrane protein [Pedobacter sp. ISL-68]|uniref:SusC/RagA family TonB-linked outer membrane protein n=1 Tax=unclassified Pedobacter TaxID=2628915 RepID=UPI001BE53327|nr:MULTISPECIES: SusC/RagA family TonB-linked outer membrane protein [unclassified Pedobacter]MBT2559847.1 SusC/RagA family TonB-linked outer membrane protein [Pedobacter sp. ISL-64]MBT2592152.1 SusC/RagA family TonB-linked outer membrane protein [Pedobacter sp. ISL-68]
MRLHLIIFTLMLAGLIATAAGVKAQNVTLEAKATPLYQIFKQVEKQTGYRFWYSGKMLDKNTPITTSITNAPLKTALDKIFADLPFTYEILDKTIVVKEKPVESEIPKEKQTKQTITGIVIDENGQPLVGASLTIKGTNKTTMTNSDGKYTFLDIADNAVLIVSYVGYNAWEVNLKNANSITLSRSDSKLDDVQVIAYGTTTKRLNTGSVVSVSAKDIERQPVSNPLAALIGRVPGLVVTQQSGVPGSSFSMQIRGRNSISQGSQPLILIDGIPFAAGNENIQLIGSAISNVNQGSGVSPFNAINPNDIESIEILKDADATAIYGSRGANGVILITSKKGQAGRTQISANFNTGVTQVGKLLPLLNTEQYTAMRNEAFANSNTIPTLINAPDLTIYDQGRYTDYQKEFLGGTGYTTNANLSLSGGSAATQFLLSGTYYKETSIFPSDLPNQRGSMLANITHKSVDNRFTVNFSGSYTSVQNRSATSDLTFYTFLSPNTPAFFDGTGKLQWTFNGASIENPYSFLREKYNINTNNLAGSLNASYKIWNGLSAKILAGYNQQFTNEQKLSPADAKSPTNPTQGHEATFGKNQLSSWNIEPQLEYTSQIWVGKLTALVGTTFLSRSNSALTIIGTGYGSEVLLESFDAATTIDASSFSSLYRYQALFSRINYNIANRYLLNITGRRDGSSRFGPGKQFANFGAVGAAWVFSTEKWMQNVSALSFGKLRASYGVTGNDQIGDYQFVETWKAATNAYVGASALIPNNLYNGNYAWERNKKIEVGLELGFLRDRVLFSVDYFKNRSDNQLINYKLPYITGFANVIANFPATVENKGWELSVSATPIKGEDFRWESNFNITIPKNTLTSFPGIEASSYKSQYIVGHSLNSIYKYTATGVNAQTGLLQFQDIDGNNAINVNDYQLNGSTDPKFYGGWQNTLSFSGFELQWFIDFKRQIGRNHYYYLYGISIPAGSKRNLPDLLASRWKQVGDVTDLPKITSASAGTQASNTLNSSFAYSDQSFIRLRNVSLSYLFKNKVLSKIGAKTGKVYVQGQNLMTFNATKGYDPETQNLTVLPALQAYTVGLQISY